MEVQDEKPRVSLPLECVGFKGIRRRIIVGQETGISLVASIDVCVSIPGSQRGAHLSRNYFAILDALRGEERGESIERFLSSIAERLLELHPYASSATVSARTVYFVEHGVSEVRNGEEPVDVLVTVTRRRGGREEWSVQISVYGMTACPSAQRTISGILGMDPSTPAPTHSQKAKLTVGVTVAPGPIVRIESLARAAFKAFSAPAVSLLKRRDEASLVLHAHRNPKLAEDVVRDAVVSVASLLSRLGYGPDTIITAEVESFESIHPQNVYARATIRLGELEGLLRGADGDLG